MNEVTLSANLNDILLNNHILRKKNEINQFTV